LAQTVTYKYTNDKLKNTFQEPGCQKTLRSMYAGHQHIQFLFYLETTTTTTILLKHTKKQMQKKVTTH